MDRPAEDIHDPLTSHSLGTLLLDFLKYYATEFPYESSYISVTNSKLLLKEDKGWESTAEPERLSIQCLINPGECLRLNAIK